MKRILSLILALALLLSMTACGQNTKTEETVLVTTNEAKDDPIDALPTDDPIYDETALMLVPVEKFVEYNHILGNSIDYSNVGAEDFWNIVAIVVSSYPEIESYASIDVAGVYHIKWNTMMEFAKTFMYKSWFANSTPSYRESYSASADPGTGYMDLIPLDVDNYDARLDYIERASAQDNCDYVMHIVLGGRDGNDDYDQHYDVYLSEWTKYLEEVYDRKDEDEHVMPYVVTGIRHVSSESRIQEESQSEENSAEEAAK